jgi:hypothetical protein
MNSAISDLAIDLGVVALDYEIENEAELVMLCVEMVEQEYRLSA